MSLKAVTFELTVVSCAHVTGLPPLSGARSMMNPFSLVELSDHNRLIWLVATAVGVRFEGSGGAGAVGLLPAWNSCKFVSPSPSGSAPGPAWGHVTHPKYCNCHASGNPSPFPSYAPVA